MKKWKKMISVLAAAALSGSILAGCGSTNDSDKDKTDFKGDTLKIGVWGGNESEEKSLEQLITNFEKDTGAKVEKKVYTDYNTQIQADMVAKTAPDAFYVDSSMYPFFEEQGVLAELDGDGYNSEDFYSPLTETFSTDNKMKAVPKDFSTLALYLNTDMFKKAGVDINSVPASYEDLAKWLPSFQEKLDQAYGKGKVFAMSYTPELSRSWHLAVRDGAEPIKADGQSNLADSKVVSNLSILTDLVHTKAVVTPQEVGTGWNGEAFGAGKIAMMDEGNWVYETLKTEFKDISFTVKEMPTYKGSKGSMMFAVGWGKYAATENSALADKWIQYVTGKDGMKLWSEGTGTLPSRQDVGENSSIKDNTVLKIHLDANEYATPWIDGTTLMTIATAYANFLPKAMDESESFEKALQAADKQANADIKNGNN